MAMVKPVIFQIVGYQNSGKTTFTLKVLQKLKAMQLKTAVIKHHGHGGKPEIVKDKDSTRHFLAGADISIVQGEGRLILHAEENEFGLQNQLKLLSLFNPDVILIEGYKNEPYPKLLLIRNANDFELITKLTNIAAVVFGDEELSTALQQEIPWFTFEEESAADWLVQLLINCVKKEG